MATAFRFSVEDHTYVDLATGAVLPSITQMLESTGWVDDTFMTEASRQRGTAVHELTKAYDLGALTLEECDSPFRGYLLAHVKAMHILRPTWSAVEEPAVSPLGFGGRPDRVGTVYNALAVLEGKSGAPTKSHAIQLALQSILVAPTLGIPPEALSRFALYWRSNGKFRLEQFQRPQDFVEARRVIKACCG